MMMRKIMLFIFTLTLIMAMPLLADADVVAVEDTYVQGGSSANANYGTAANMLVKSGSSNTARKALVKFDLSNINKSVNTDELILRLYVSQKQANNAKDITLSAYAWDNDWQENSATWYSLFGTTGGYTPTEKISSCNVTTSSVGSFVTINVGEYITRQVEAGERYASILLSDENGGNSVFYFSSKDSDNSGNFPALVTESSYFSLNLSFDEDDTNSLICTLAGLGQLRDGRLIAALYDELGVLIGCKSQTVNTTEALTYTFNVTDWRSEITEHYDVNDSIIKVFLWKNVTPYADVQSAVIPFDNNEITLNYINNIPDNYAFEDTGITKEYYLDVMQKCLDAYTYEEILYMSATSDIQTYGRIVSTVAALISSGRDCGYNEMFPDMMTKACRAIESNKKAQALDFAVKEIMIAYILMADSVEPEVKAQWDQCLSAITPVEWYDYVSGSNHNINIYNLAGEWLRDYTGIYDSTSYFERCWPAQLEKFDVNGMYPDNNSYLNPMLYDLTSRVQMQLITGYGYDGQYRSQMDDIMAKGGLMTLMSQSAAYELPYGGRSNQYLFNEALIASNCEYEATRYKAMGDLKTAGAYKRAAHLAIKSIDRWLDAEKHIKNFYVSNKTGIENYGYYNKYMITLSSFLAIGCLSADDTIAEMPCPAEIGGYVMETTNRFNKIFANCSGYSIEIDTKSEKSYDSTGLGRIHKAGVPTELGLSMPMTSAPGYTLMADATKADLSIEVGAQLDDGTVSYISSYRDLSHTTQIIKQSYNEVIFKVTYSGGTLTGCSAVEETYTINSSGVKINAKLVNPIINKIYFRVPLLNANGDKDGFASVTQITSDETSATVTMGNNSYKVETNGTLTVGDTLYGNRNGTYYSANISKDGAEIEIKLTLN